MTTNHFIEIKKAIWALDVFTDIPESENKVVKNVTSLFATFRMNPKITPVNVFPGIHTESHFPFVSAEITNRLQKINTFKLEPVEVIPENMIYPTSVDDKVNTLIKYTKKNNIDLIIAATHSHKLTSHYLIGSFTKDLISQSPVSLLLINPNCEIKSTIKKVFVPLESIELSEFEINIITNIVNRMNASLTLFFHLQDQASDYFDSDGSVGMFLKAYNKKRSIQMESYQKNLKIKLQDKITDLKIENIIDSSSSKESMLNYLKYQEHDLILLGGKDSKLNKNLPNSSVEFISRNATCPVLIIR